MARVTTMTLKTKEEALEFYKKHHPNAVAIALNDQPCKALYPYAAAFRDAQGNAWGCSEATGWSINVALLARSNSHSINGYRFGDLFSDPDSLVWYRGHDEKPAPVVEQQVKPLCVWNNKRAPDLDITYPTKPASMSPYAEESYYQACVAVEEAGFRRARRVLREMPVCNNPNGAVELCFTEQPNGKGHAYWSCDCTDEGVGPPVAVKPAEDEYVRYIRGGSRASKTQQPQGTLTIVYP
jgi:hypothetical protein